MNPATLILVFALFFVLFISKRNYQKIYTALSIDEKNRFVSGINKHRVFQYVVLVLVLIPVMMLGGDISTIPFYLYVLFYAGVSALFLWLGPGLLLLRKRLVELSMPDAFIKALITDRLILAIVLAGFLIYIYLKMNGVHIPLFNG